MCKTGNILSFYVIQCGKREIFWVCTSHNVGNGKYFEFVHHTMWKTGNILSLYIIQCGKREVFWVCTSYNVGKGKYFEFVSHIIWETGNILSLYLSHCGKRKIFWVCISYNVENWKKFAQFKIFSSALRWNNKHLFYCAQYILSQYTCKLQSKGSTKKRRWSSSSQPQPSSSIVAQVFTLIYLTQTTSTGNTVLQPFCSYYSCCI